MQFRDLKQQYQELKKDMDEAMIKVVTDCNFISGVRVAELEKELAESVGVKHCITCANGTDALSIAMMVWSMGPGDAVFVPDFTFFSSGEIVSHCGATPISIRLSRLQINTIFSFLRTELRDSEGRLTAKKLAALEILQPPLSFRQSRWDVMETVVPYLRVTMNWQH